MATQVIDVSTHNGAIDFRRVKAAGIENVIIRCGFTGYGSSHTLNKDARFEENYRKAKEAGLHVGTYYYAVALTEADADREAAFVLSLLKDKQFELPIYYDVEDVHDTRAAGVLTQNMQGLSKAQLTAIVNRFCDTVEKAGYFVGIYSGKYWFRDELDMSVLNRYTVWLAHWTTQTDYTGPYALWQYTDSGRVDGIQGNVDMNILYQDFAPIIKRLGLNGFPKQTEPAEPAILKGDADGDGSVTEDDALLTLRRSVGLETFTAAQEKRADMDNDGSITAEDAREILRKSAGLED
ncbi:MAG: hypothetical protein IKB13_10940 [Clostridia bacterium]|nr:hypothetical protein [Clostridia bacterium]